MRERGRCRAGVALEREATMCRVDTFERDRVDTFEHDRD